MGGSIVDGGGNTLTLAMAGPCSPRSKSQVLGDDRPWLNPLSPLKRKEGAIGPAAHAPRQSALGADRAVGFTSVEWPDRPAGALYAGGVLHGRDLERARLGELLEAARAGRAGSLLIRGEPGMGKSALLG